MKKKIIIFIIIMLLILSCGIGYYMYRQYLEQKKIDEKVSDITKIEQNFYKNEDRNDKLIILKSMISEQKKDYNSDEKVRNKYEKTIKSMQTEFLKEYDKIIQENVIENLNELEDKEIINNHTQILNTLWSTIEAEKDYTFSNRSECDTYTKKISTLIEKYSNRMTALEEKEKAEAKAKKQEEEARKKAEQEKAKSHYENEYFSVDVPSNWSGKWTVSEEDNSLNGIASTAYYFSYNGDNSTLETSSGGATVYVLDMSDTSRPLSHYSRMIPPDCEEVGITSSGYHDVFKMEVAAGFFDHGATITLK